MASSRKKLPPSAWQRWIKWVAGTGLLSAILLGIAGGPLGDIGNFLRDRIRDFFSPPSQEIKIDFNATRACAQGKLTDVRKLFADPNTPLTSGELAFHYHSSGHTATPADWREFLDFAERHFRQAKE